MTGSIEGDVPIGARLRAWRGRSVLVRQHHRQNACRDRRVGGIRGHQLHFSVVIIDLPEAADNALLDEAEVVLAVRVVVLVEPVERPDLREDQATPISRQRFKALP